MDVHATDPAYSYCRLKLIQIEISARLLLLLVFNAVVLVDARPEVGRIAAESDFEGLRGVGGRRGAGEGVVSG